METKTCSCCKCTLPLDNFSKYNSKRDGVCIYSKCKQCKSKSRKWIPLKDRTDLTEDEKLLRTLKNNEASRKYRATNKEKSQEVVMKYRRSEKGKISFLRARDRYRKSAKGRAKDKEYKSKRSKHLKTAGPLNASSIKLVENYNKKYFLSNNLTCEYCLSSIEGAYNLEHMIPLIKGGTNHYSNLAISCPPCNAKKFVDTVEVFMPDKVAYFLIRNNILKENEKT